MIPSRSSALNISGVNTAGKTNADSLISTGDQSVFSGILIMFSCLVGFCLGWIIHPRLNDSTGVGHRQAHLLGNKQFFRLLFSSWALGFGFSAWALGFGMVFAFWSWDLCFGMVFAFGLVFVVRISKKLLRILKDPQ